MACYSPLREPVAWVLQPFVEVWRLLVRDVHGDEGVDSGQPEPLMPLLVLYPPHLGARDQQVPRGHGTAYHRHLAP